MNRVFISNQASSHKLNLSLLQSFALFVLKRLRYRNTILSLTFVSDSAIKKLNKKHLRHNYATDVLAFPLAPPRFLGEIVISPQRARVQAKQFGAAFGEELLRYVAHGILHLHGFKDRSKKEQMKMRRKEDQLLKGFR